MLKALFFIVVGVMIAFCFVGLTSRDTSASLRAAGQLSKEKVEEIRQDYCREKYLEDTHCFQVMSAARCELEIERNCR